jgi:putative tryptophan/tyrosine transport system substrate-binding protein
MELPMQRRIMILASISLLSAAGQAFAQSGQKMVRIGILVGDTTAPHEEEALLAGLREQGLVEGKNLTIERRHGDGQLQLVPGYARELAAMKLDAVVSTCTPTTLVAQQVFGTSANATPIVMAAVADPVGQQIIASLARPGANVTGLASQAVEIMPKMLSLFAAVLPAKARVAVLVDASSMVHPHMWQTLQPLATSLDIALVQVQAGRKPGQAALPAAFESAARQKVDGIFVLPDEPFFFARRAEIVALAAKHRMAAFYGVREFVDAGGLMSYGESMRAAYRGVGSYIGRLVAGARPSEIPVTQPTEFELVVNLKTAKALGITVPRDVLLSANAVLQ